MKQVASLRYGVMFKKAFSQVDVFKGFVKDILGIDLQIDQVETEKSFPKPIGSVDSRFDLFAEDKVNRVIVDIQHRRHGDYYDRFLHYHCAALLEQVVSARNYSPSLKVYTIVVLTAGDRHQRDMVMIDFDPKDRDGIGIGEIPHKVIYLCPKYVNERTPEPWREWMLAINDSLDEEMDESAYHNAYVQRVIHSIEKDAITSAEHARMKDEYSEEELRREEERQAKLEGLEEGVEKGKQLALEAVARELLQQGAMSDAVIAQVTGLSLEAVQGLR